ncbi:TEA/ATTS domain family-domain-containing protein [Protomyces lactucae-debilis]|uniref:TEA/ATTS domain family-domain-containing protein n=1 Tax=Protomyces lactucae-debilis TaxID=2754530 RepID=A0A1Y2F011_PROLT|nr:TEA/ATTS domain family-domain-containing protein [Protomyces lactucae-debilis]ORY77047.1 TEA/ATTS domain family-domain-containing protein [Protomyces lactucae-debilis]
MSVKAESISNRTRTPARKLLLSPIDLTPPSSTKKRALGDLSINIPPRPHSVHDFTTPEHPNQNKKHRKIDGQRSAPLSAEPFQSTTKRVSADEDAVWGPEVEAAFMDALRRMPKLGRRKVEIHGKPCGRNELIAEYIFRRTGKTRTRKQVSSHIQVLKHLRRDDALFVALVADIPGAGEDPTAEYDVEKLLSLSPTTTIPTPFSAKPLLSARLDQTSPLCQVTRARTPVFAQDNVKVVRVEDFCIWATCKKPEDKHAETFAVYTKLQQPVRIGVSPLEELFNWPSRFPTLSQMLEEPSGAQSPIFRMRAGLLLPRSLDLAGEAQVVLRTHLALAAQLSDAREEWTCTTRVYSMGNRVLELKQRVTMDMEEARDDVSGLMRRQVHARASVPFATDFWAAFLSGLSCTGIREDDEDERARKFERDAEIAIAGVTMTQQIGTIETALEPSRPICLLLWEFDLSTGSRPGETTVTRIAVPKKATQPIRPALMVRSASMSNTIPRVKPVRPRMLPAGAHLQRSFSLASVPSQPAKPRETEFIAYHGPPDAVRPRYLPTTSQPRIQAQAYHQPHRAPPPARLQKAQQLPSAPPHQVVSQLEYYAGHYDEMPLSSPANLTYNPMSQYASTQPPMHLVAGAPGAVVNGGAPPMSRSFSAPTWHPSPVGSNVETWDGNFIDWTLPESAGYLQTDFQIASDDCFGTVSTAMTTPQLCPPEIPSSVAPDVFLVKPRPAPPSRTASATPASLSLSAPVADYDDGMPRLGFFPLQH